MVSEAQVEEARRAFEDGKTELPATGEFNAAIASLKEVINIESELDNLKVATVSISKGYHKDYLGID